MMGGNIFNPRRPPNEASIKTNLASDSKSG